MMNNSELEAFYKLFFERIYKFFYYKTTSKTIAEDLAADTFVEFVEQLKNKNIENHKSYLYGVASNIWMNFLRQKYKQQTNVLSELSCLTEEYIDTFVEKFDKQIDLTEKILPYIEKLPESQKTIAELRFKEKLTLTEICDKTGRDMNYVKTTQKRAIASLKSYIQTT